MEGEPAAGGARPAGGSGPRGAPSERVRRWLVVLVATTATCGGNGRRRCARRWSTWSRPRWPPSRQQRGGPQRYFEVNATPQLVNVFVAVDEATATVPYVYVDGELGPAAPSQAAEGATFTADAVAFDPATVLDEISEDLPDSEISLFSIIGGPGDAVRYGALVRSPEGGTLDITVDADGRVLAVDPR